MFTLALGYTLGVLHQISLPLKICYEICTVLNFHVLERRTKVRESLIMLPEDILLVSDAIRSTMCPLGDD